MDQDNVLGHDTYLDGGLVRDPGMASGRMTDFQSEDMDMTAQPSGAESYSEQPMESQDARHSRGNPDPTWGEGENETAKCRRLYPKVWPYIVPVPQRIDSGWYQGEDLMDPGEVASLARRVGRPNVACLPIVQVRNTPITVESCVDKLPILRLKRTRKVSSLTSLRRNVLREPRIKIRPSEVMVIGKISWLDTTTFQLPRIAR